MQITPLTVIVRTFFTVVACAPLLLQSMSPSYSESVRQPSDRMLAAQRLIGEANKLRQSLSRAQKFRQEIGSVEHTKFPDTLDRIVRRGNSYAIETKNIVETFKIFQGEIYRELPNLTEPTSNSNYRDDFIPCLLGLVDRVLQVSIDIRLATASRLRLSDASSVSDELESMLDRIGQHDYASELVNVCGPPFSLAPHPPVANLPPHARPPSGTAFAPFAVFPKATSTIWDPICFESEKELDKKAPHLSYPSVASILYNDGLSGPEAFCSGTLVASNAVLTAAHCFCNTIGKDPHYGAFHRNFGKCRTGQYQRMGHRTFALDPSHHSVFLQHVGAIDIKKIIIHEKFQMNRLPRADLALIILGKKVEGVQPTPLNTFRSTPPGTFGTTVGYGYFTPIGGDGIPEETLQVIEKTGLKLEADILTGQCSTVARWRSMICWVHRREVGGTKLGSNCLGDSGGPLFIEVGKIRYLAGVTSAGGGDCRPGTRTYDFDVFKFRKWIKGHLLDNPPDQSSTNPAKELNQLACKMCTECDTDKGRPETIVIPSAKANRLLVTVNCTPSPKPYEVSLKPQNGDPQRCGDKSNSTVRQCPELTVKPSDRYEIAIRGAVSRHCQVVATTFVR